MTILAIIALLTSGTWASEPGCPEAADLGAVHDQLQVAEQSFAKLDKAGVLVSTAEARVLVRCLDVALDPADAARFHRAQGLAFFLEHRETEARASFAAARRTQPGYSIPPTLAVEGHPLYAEFQALDPSQLPTEPVPSLGEGQLVIDGRAVSLLQPDLPAVMQLLDVEGVVAWSILLEPGTAPTILLDLGKPGATVPTELAQPADSTQPVLGLSHPPPQRPISRPLLVGSGASLVAAGVCYGLAWRQWTHWDTADTIPELNASYTRSHQLTIASGVAVAVGAGLGVSAVIAKRW